MFGIVQRASMNTIFLALQLPPVLLDHFHTDHLETPFVGERPAVVSAHHRTLLIVVDELAKHTGARKARESAEIDTRLCVPRTCEDTTGSRTEGHHVSGARK